MVRSVILAVFFTFVFCQYYNVVGDIVKTDNGFKGTMRFDSSRSGKNSPPGTVEYLNFQFFFETENRVHMKIVDTNNTRWEVPDVVISETPSSSPSNLNFDIYITRSPFSFKIVRKSDNYAIFNTNGLELYYADQFIEISTVLGNTNPNIYGLGERKHNFRLDPNDRTYVMFNKDHLTPPDVNLYGTHPFYLELLMTGKSHGVFILNSNAQEFNINGPNQSLTYRTIGGILDMYFFLGDSSKEVVLQYQEVIGKPYMPPYWSLGYHQSRYGLKSLKVTRDVVQEFKDQNIPLETMWNDIDFMDQEKDWTVDPVYYPMEDFKSFLKELHDNNQHYIQIFDVGIKNETGYEPFDSGEKMNVFIKESDGIHDLIGKVWPGYCAYPDFWNSNAKEWFLNELKNWYTQLPLDGLWIDMNEPSSFCNGQCNGREHKPIFVKNRNSRREEEGVFDPMNPPYTPGGVDLNEVTIRMDGRTNLSIIYNVHNLYGFQESVLTNEFLTEFYQKRPFVVTRASFSGSGRYTSKWTGDNFANFGDLFYSISGCLSMSLFGIPVCGADICGFIGDTNAELCSRWYKLGSFYPFMRNHNAKGNIDQYPYSLGATVLKTSTEGIFGRYVLMPYLYTLLWKSSEFGETIMRPLFFEFPPLTPKSVLPMIDRQFMWGDALLISPVVESGKNSVNIYVPDDIWYDYHDYSLLVCDDSKQCKCSKVDDFCTIPAELDQKINIHIRGGKIIPRKQVEHIEDILTTIDLRKNHPFEIFIALNEKKEAQGELYIDDGDQIDSYTSGKYTLISFTHENNQMITAKPSHNYDVTKEKMILEKITVMGVNKTVTSVTVQGISYSDWLYLTNTKVLVIQNLDISILSDIQIQYTC